MAEFRVKMVRPPERALAGLDKRTIARAWVKAANKTLAKAKTAASKEVRKVYTIKAGRFKQALLKIRASRSKPYAILRAVGKRIPIISFRARQARKGVRVKIKKSESPKLIPSSFIATMKSGHEGVFMRTDKRMKSNARRQAIQEKFTISVPQAVQTKAVFAGISKVIAADSARIFAQSLQFELDKAAKRK